MLWRYLVACLVWVGAAFAALWIAAETKIGPVVAIVGPTHGIHSGDVIAVVVFGFAASLVSAALLRPPARDGA